MNKLTRKVFFAVCHIIVGVDDKHQIQFSTAFSRRLGKFSRHIFAIFVDV